MMEQFVCMLLSAEEVISPSNSHLAMVQKWRILSACEKTPRNQDKSLMTCFSKIENWHGFLCLSRCSG
ncbi:mCG147481 [Mus musculus]|nr:mCG147481 [Mus musculus]